MHSSVSLTEWDAPGDSQAREVAITREQWEAMKQAEAERIRQAALSGDPVEDDMFDDDIG